MAFTGKKWETLKQMRWEAEHEKTVSQLTWHKNPFSLEGQEDYFRREFMTEPSLLPFNKNSLALKQKQITIAAQRFIHSGDIDRLRERAAVALRGAIKRDSPECLGCQHCKFKEEKIYRAASDEESVQITAKCELSDCKNSVSKITVEPRTDFDFDILKWPEMRQTKRVRKTPMPNWTSPPTERANPDVPLNTIDAW